MKYLTKTDIAVATISLLLSIGCIGYIIYENEREQYCRNNVPAAEYNSCKGE